MQNLGGLVLKLVDSTPTDRGQDLKHDIPVIHPESLETRNTARNAMVLTLICIKIPGQSE
jgi:hypothetical protein